MKALKYGVYDREREEFIPNREGRILFGSKRQARIVRDNETVRPDHPSIVIVGVSNPERDDPIQT